MRCRPFAIIALVIAACSGQEAGTDDVCGLAAEHVASCLGTEPVSIGAACEGDAADLAGQTLTTSCDELKSDDKGDGQSNGLATLACISLGAPIFAHGLEENELCCFDYNCEGALVCRKF